MLHSIPSATTPTKWHYMAFKNTSKDADSKLQTRSEYLPSQTYQNSWQWSINRILYLVSFLGLCACQVYIPFVGSIYFSSFSPHFESSYPSNLIFISRKNAFDLLSSWRVLGSISNDFLIPCIKLLRCLSGRRPVSLLLFCAGKYRPRRCLTSGRLNENKSELHQSE